MSTFRADLEPLVTQAEAAILKIVRHSVPGARLMRIGPISIDKPSWSCWVVTNTDKERDGLATDGALKARLNAAADEAGFAPDSFSFQSQETVNRDCNGSWFNAMR